MSTPDLHALDGELVDGRYRVLSHLADGGMASVWLALDTRLDRDIALKVMRPDLARDAEFVQRFRREAQAAARLSHPNVVAVFDQGMDRGIVFLAMELVPGTTLRQWLARVGALTPREALDTTQALLQALDAAHRAGIVHRDIKPENVLIGDDGTIKVADFGLARALTTSTSTGLTGAMLGTVGYLAPEQVERGVSDTRSDVYAVGLLLFEMLTGRKAVEGDSPIHVAYQHVHGQIDPPSFVEPSVPAELDALVAFATARDPDRRPADAGAFLTQLLGSRRALSPEQLDARPMVVAGDAGASHTSAVHAPTTAIPLTHPVGGVGSPAAPPGVRAGSPLALESGEQAAGRAPARTALVASPRPRRGVRVVLSLLAALVVLAAVTGWYLLFGPGGDRTVPVVANKTQAVAVAALTENDLGATIVQTFSEDVPSGSVVSSDPVAGAATKRGRVVTLTVSKGLERYVVPDLAGKKVDEATKLLSAVTLSVGTTTQEYSESVATGLIIASSPDKGASVKRASTVALRISKGREPITVTDHTGQPFDAAKSEWEGRGLNVKVSSQEFSDSVAKDSIISQDPTTATAHRGDTITVVVSKGQDLVQIPDVSGRGEAEARRMLEQAGFSVSVNRYIGGILGLAQSTNPGSGTMAPRGSRVTLRIV